MPGRHLTGGARAVGALADTQDRLYITWTNTLYGSRDEDREADMEY
jgi:hypothetical protein